MFAWLATSAADVKALRDSWGSARGGWRAARRDAAELLAHRRISVDTQAMTPGGMQVVLRTRVRLSGDTETDILRPWRDTVAPAAMDAVVTAHFQSVAAATAGFAAAVGIERLVVRAAVLAGSVASLVVTAWHLWQTEPSWLIEALLRDRTLLTALALLLSGVLLRVILRWRLRAIFRRGLSGMPARS
jgi:hypothetical protein